MTMWRHAIRRAAGALGRSATAGARASSRACRALSDELVEVGRRAYASAERGQSMVEYAIVVAVVAIAALATVQLFGTGVATIFQNLLAKVQGLGR